MTCKIQKWNKYNWAQERNFVISNLNIYNFNKKSKFYLYKYAHYIFYTELRRVISIESLNGMTKNLQKGSNEFVIHVDSEPDYRVSGEL